jgi:prepilin signal peptidase PulO-like enzyme (type II secretory pathway)
MAKTKVEQELRNMKLHRTMKVGNFVILRVIGGWIYWNERLAKGAVAGVFVPNSEESFSIIRKMRKELGQSKK